LSSYCEQIVNCGYTGPINEDNKENITRFNSAIFLNVFILCIFHRKYNG